MNIDHLVYRMANIEKVFIFLVIPILANLIVVDFLSAKAYLTKEPNHTTNTTIVYAASMTPSPKPTATPTPQAQSAFVPLTFTPTPTVREFFVPFGTGQSTAEDWTSIDGLQVYVDTKYYGDRRTVLFEASLRIPTGNETAYVRLYNVTDKHPVWMSELSTDGGIAKMLVSNPITLDEGKKLYQVQMKTSLKYQAILDQARLHIVVY